MKKTLATLILFAFIALIYLLVVQKESGEVLLQIDSSENAKKLSDELQLSMKSIYQLEQLVLDLKQQNLMLSKKLELANRKLVKVITHNTNSDNPDQVVIKQPVINEEKNYKPQKTADEIIISAMQSGVSVYDSLESNFVHQEVDYEWAPKQEENLWSLINDNENLQSLGITEVKCKERWCAVELLPSQQNSNVDISTNFIFAMKDQGWYSENIVFYETSDDGESTSVFISRDNDENTLSDMLKRTP
ncbi:hypothetical protein D5R81_07655 [Parashewanella spongiae]|uniref:Uncharacterized protein n=1 Tax=Parashewanella spongiae TaxID=342950 RepID=A0A3A6TP01_9GAMM|nr:hypothetical protein [Parashewanella spongiae]MCL1077113.1 hypothetical protein [Parashewanella spongiae]RJY17654.1 hypothetical protein D5R81_07655 [Parashewanella spongiae]